MTTELNRREMLRMTAAAGVAAGIGSTAFGQKEPQPIRIGVIGTGGRGRGVMQEMLNAGVEVPALCDIDSAALKTASNMVAKVRGGRALAHYGNGPKDYRRLLERDDVQAVFIATPIQLHASIAIDAMRAGKHVLSEVGAAMTLDECWGLVRTTEETGKLYMLAENCCYYESVLVVLNMVRKGLFGELTYADCGYVHELPSILFRGNGELTWRGELARDCTGNWYPTHPLGPVAQMLGINRGDRMVSLAAGCTGNASLRKYVHERFPAGHPARQIAFKGADSTSVLIHTAKGALITLRFDVFSPRPVAKTTHICVQGTAGSFEHRDSVENIYIAAPGKAPAWEPYQKYAKEYGSPLWAKYREQAAGAGHGGIDFFTILEFLNMLRRGGPSPIDCYDAAAWSAVTPLSVKSLAEGGKVQEFPDFTQGKWKTRRG